jgi:hypothetical protein
MRLLFTITATALVSLSCASAAWSAPQLKPDNGPKLYGQISAFGAACISSGVTPLSTQLPTSVELVKPGSPAYYAGVQQGDKILSATLETNRLNLKIERNSQIFLVKLRARTDTVSKAPATSAPAVRFNLWEKLKAYKLAFIIDHSGSMSEPLGNSKKTRWSFIKEQFELFCRSAEDKGVSPFDLCLFSENFELEKGLNAEQFTRGLQGAVTTGSTLLAPALKATLDYESTASAAKPLLLFVITDGQAMTGKEILATVSDYGTRFGRGQRIKIICIQSGYSEEGALFVTNLTAECKRRGLTDFVSAVLYEEIAEKGVAQVIEPFVTASTEKKQ